MKTIELVEGDAAIIFRADGQRELTIPTSDNEDEEIGEPGLLVALCTIVLDDDRLRNEAITALDNEIREMEDPANRILLDCHRKFRYCGLWRVKAI